jgi:hypothetical protein
MTLLTEYRGRMLNHVELLYQRGERDLAVAFLEALGCQIVDTNRAVETGATMFCAFPQPGETDLLNNVMYVSEVRPVQYELENALTAAMERDSTLRSAVANFRHKAATAPHGNPHFGVRYPSFESLDATLDRLEHGLDDRLRDRVSVFVVRPKDSQALVDTIVQAFVETDVVTAGLFATGQLIELQAQHLE